MREQFQLLLADRLEGCPLRGTTGHVVDLGEDVLAHLWVERGLKDLDAEHLRVVGVARVHDSRAD